MEKRKNKHAEAKYWEEQVNGFCGIFGFRLDEKPVLDVYVFGARSNMTRFSVKAGRSVVAYNNKNKNKAWRSSEFPLAFDTAGTSRAAREKVMEAIMRKASGAELIVRSSDKDRKTPYGFTKVRLVRHILLPEFGSVEELKLKLAASGESEP